MEDSMKSFERDDHQAKGNPRTFEPLLDFVSYFPGQQRHLVCVVWRPGQLAAEHCCYDLSGLGWSEPDQTAPETTFIIASHVFRQQ
jgi:hypothetical protein